MFSIVNKSWQRFLSLLCDCDKKTNRTWYSVALVKFHWFKINWHILNQSECINCYLYIIIQKIAPQAKSGKYFQIWFSYDLGGGGGGNGGVLSMRMQVILDSSFPARVQSLYGAGRKESSGTGIVQFMIISPGGEHGWVCSTSCLSFYIKVPGLT